MREFQTKVKSYNIISMILCSCTTYFLQMPMRVRELRYIMLWGELTQSTCLPDQLLIQGVYKRIGSWQWKGRRRVCAHCFVWNFPLSPSLLDFDLEASFFSSLASLFSSQHICCSLAFISTRCRVFVWLVGLTPPFFRASVYVSS